MAESTVQVTEGAGKLLHTWTRTIGGNTVHDEAVWLAEAPLATYTVRGASLSTATLDSHLLQIMAGATLHVLVRSIRVYQQVAATTAALVACDIVQLTTAGTGGGAVTPVRVDTGDAAAGATGMTLPTAKGTEGSIIDSAAGYFVQTISASLGVPGQSLVWAWDWDSPRAKSLRIPAGTTNGIAVKVRNATAGAQVLVIAKIVELNYLP